MARETFRNFARMVNSARSRHLTSTMMNLPLKAGFGPERSSSPFHGMGYSLDLPSELRLWPSRGPRRCRTTCGWALCRFLLDQLPDHADHCWMRFHGPGSGHFDA